MLLVGGAVVIAVPLVPRLFAAVPAVETVATAEDVIDSQIVGSTELHRVEVNYWQTYSASPLGGVHEWIASDAPYEIFEVDSPSNVRSGYLWTDGERLMLDDLADTLRFDLTDGTASEENGNSMRFQAGGRVFDFISPFLTACGIAHPDECESIEISQDSFPYVFAESNGAVVSITNVGEAFLFSDGTWQQMARHDDVYDLFHELSSFEESEDEFEAGSEEGVDDEPAAGSENQAIQFYSSIHFQGRTLLGEWPTGRLYEFDGARIAPSSLTMGKFAEDAPSRLGWEAQSMAEYCGDLFVGYWPTGEVYRLDGQTQEWSLLTRFFTDYQARTQLLPWFNRFWEPPFIPLSNREADDLDWAFFGQRVTALVPFGDSLYASTSNLREWATDLVISDSIPQEIQSEYGKVHRIYKPGCSTSYAATS